MVNDFTWVGPQLESAGDPNAGQAFTALSPAPPPATPTVTVASQDFDGGALNLLSQSLSPDNSGNSPPGAFPGSSDDVFGIVNRTVDFDFADDSANGFPADSFGILGAAKVDNVFGVEDLNNSNNPAGTGAAVFTFDVAGYENLEISIDMAAMGDFEAGADQYLFTATLDGGPVQSLFVSSVDEAATQTYTLEDGDAFQLDDPLAINNVLLDNQLQTFTVPILGTGDILTLTFTALNDGDQEVFLFDNILITGNALAVPEPESLAVWGLLGLLGLLALRRARR